MTRATKSFELTMMSLTFWQERCRDPGYRGGRDDVPASSIIVPSYKARIMQDTFRKRPAGNRQVLSFGWQGCSISENRTEKRGRLGIVGTSSSQ